MKKKELRYRKIELLKNRLIKASQIKKNNSFNMPFVLSVLDLFIKSGAVSLIPSGIIVYVYLNSIGFRNFFSSAVGLQSGLIAVFLFFGLFCFSNAIIFAFNPWMIWQTKRLINKPQVEEYFSFRKVTGLNASIQLVLLLISVLKIQNSELQNWLLCLFTVAIPIIASLQIKKIDLDIKGKILYAFFMFFALSATIFPWLVLIPIIESVKFAEVNSIYKDIFQFSLILIWIGFYSASSAFLVNSAAKKLKNDESDEREHLLLIRNCLIVAMFVLTLGVLITPKVFISSAMYGSALRETPRDSKWYAIDTLTFQKVVVDENIVGRIKKLNGVVYVCGYSAFSTADRFILCPQNVNEPNPNQCPIFTISEARPIPTSAAETWACSTKNNAN